MHSPLDHNLASIVEMTVENVIIEMSIAHEMTGTQIGVIVINGAQTTALKDDLSVSRRGSVSENDLRYPK